MLSRRRHLTTALLVAGLTAGIAGAVGCGSSDSGSNRLDVMGQAADATAKQASFRMHQVTEQEVLGKTVSIKSDGAFAGKRGHLTLDLSPFASLLSGLPQAAQVLDRVGGAAALKGELVLDGKTLLFRLPALQQGLKSFAKRDVPEWASIDVGQVGKTLGIDIGSLLAGSTGNQQVVAYLRALTGSLKTVGTERIDGIDTTHYRGTVDIANLPKGSVPPAMRKALEQSAKLIKRVGGSTKNPLDVWVGKDDLVRREVISQSVKGMTTKTTIDFSDYGKPVQIKFPPAAARYDLLALVNELAPGALAAAAQQLKTVR